MSFADNQTQELWRNFMQKRKLIGQVVGPELYSVEVFNNPRFFQDFNPRQTFEKWAAVRVSDLDAVPESMEALIIPPGRYAVFQYRGKGSEAAPTYQYIFGSWLPNSGFVLDDRPHFALMGEQYKNEDPDSEEELWIPVKEGSLPEEKVLHQ